MFEPHGKAKPLLAIATFVVAYGAACMLITNTYYQLIFTLVLIYATLGLAWNVLSGYSGLVSFGHASFFGIGAYTTAFLSLHFHVTPWIGIPVGALFGGLAGVLIGYPTLRLRGVFFGLAMLAYPLVLLYVWEWLGLAEMALRMERASPALFMQFSERRVFLLVALAMTALALVINLYVERSRFGLALLAIKQNEQAAMASGIDVFRRKLQAIALSGMMAAAAGGLYMVLVLVITPASVFGVIVSAQALVVTLFGGVATLWGPIIGAVILIPLGEILTAELGDRLPGIQGVVYGIAIILVILQAPEGLYWKIRDLLFKGREPTLRALSPAESKGATNLVARAVTQPADDIILQVENVSKSFGGLKAVKDVSFIVRKGEVLGIIGPNGAGKTTLFNLLNGFVKRDGGSVKFEGLELPLARPDEVCRVGVGRTFQVVRPFPRMTVLENVMVGAIVESLSSEQAALKAEGAMRFVGMWQKADLLAGSLTNIDLRRMELARSLASDPRLVLLDETLAGLGHAEVDVMIEIIDRLRASGKTVVIIEHTMHAMVRLADRFLVLDHGQALADGPPGEVMKNPHVMEAYLGKKWMKNVA